jgi:PhnB protein
MGSKLNPYLNFDGNGREAIEFYRDVFGGELTTSSYAEGGMADNPADADRLMHGQLETPAGFTLMAADGPSGEQADAPGAFSISLSGDDEAELRGYWDKLAEGGTITMPLEKAPWGDSFGMLKDRFGTPWMVNISGSSQG